MDRNTYERDFHAWAVEQAALLRSGRLSEADVVNIAEEIDSMGRSERRELVSRLRVLFHHLLKWRHQPNRRGNSWRLSIANARDELAAHLRDNPSLKARLPGAIDDAYRLARRDAALDTGLATDVFPGVCPWSFDEAVEEAYWPE